MSYEVGSVDIAKYSLPSGYKEMCFVDLEKVNISNLFDYPQIRTYVLNRVEKNVFFFYDGGFDADYIPDLGVSYYPYFSCLDRKGAVEVRIEGAEGKGKIRLPVRKEYCENAFRKPWGCLVLDIIFGEGYRQGCHDDYDIC